MHPWGSRLDVNGYIFGGEFYDPEAKKVICNTGGVVEALGWEIENARKWPIEKVASFAEGVPDYSQPNSGIATGRQVYLYTGYWCAEALDKYAPDLDYGVFLTPTLGGTEAEKANYVVLAWTYCIPKLSKRPDEAWQLMEYMFYDHAWETGVTTINGNCVLAQMDMYEKGVMEWLGPDNRLTPYFAVFCEAGRKGKKGWPPIPGSLRYRDELGRAEDYATRGERTAQQALDDCAQIVQTELDEALSQS